MRYAGKSKIGKLSTKGINYPQLRLPSGYCDTIGQVADVIETEYEGRRAFLIVTEQTAPNSDTVLKPSAKVLKPAIEPSAEFRLSALESQIADLKSILLNDNAQKDAQLSKEKKIKGRGRDSNPRRGLHRAIG
jgi:hypothetical protein